MRLSRRKIQYLEAHFRRYSNAKLAKALNVDKEVVRKALKKRGLVRTEADRTRIRHRPEAELPEYTGRLPAPKNPVKLTRAHFAAATACSLLTFAIYFRTLGPTVTGEDAGELVTAAYTMGIAHPPGYPLWCMLGKLFTVIVPFGTVAWRVNLMSGFFGAATVFIVCLIIVKLRAHPVAAAEFWEQCTIAEIYSLNTFLIALCVFLLFAWYEYRKDLVLCVFAVVYGLGLCNHNTMHFLGPVFVLFVFAVDREPWRRWKLYAFSMLLTALVLFVHIYLPIRAQANPPVNWGNPSNWENFWDVVTRKQYAFGFKKDPRTPARFAMQTWHFLKLYTREFTPWLMWAPILGIVGLWQKEKGRLAFLVGLSGYLVFGFIFLLNFNSDKQSLWLNNVFWIPAYMVAAIFMGCGIGWLSSARLWRVPLRVPAVLLGLATVALPLKANFHPNDKSDYYFAYDYGMNILTTLDENAIYIPSADHATFPALYLQAVEGLQPDVAIGNKYGYPEESLYQDMPVEMRRSFRKIPTEREEAIIEDWIIAHTDRPVYFTKKRAFPALPGTKVVNCGLVYRVLRPDEEPPDRDFWAEYAWHTLDAIDTRGEFTAELVLADYHFALGRHLLDQDEAEQGLEHFSRAVAIASETREGLNNLGSACAEHRLMEAAENFFNRALELDADYALSLGNLGKLYLQTARPQHALPLWKRLHSLQPPNPEPQWMLVDCFTQLGRIDEAIAQLEELAVLTPNDPKVYREMGMRYLNYKQDAEMARRLFARSLSLDPNQPELAMFVNQPSQPQLPGPPREIWDTEGLPIPTPTIPVPRLPTVPQPGPPRPR